MKRILLAMMVCITGSMLCSTDGAQQEEKSIVVIIPSYNNEKWCQRCLQSVYDQEYENYRVIYVDDCSSDATYELVSMYVEMVGQSHRTTIIRNPERRGAMYNLYHAICSCADYEIAATLDGDDWLKHDRALARVNQEYQDPDVWLTYGHYEYLQSKRLGPCAEIPAEIVAANGFRKHEWVSSQLRTFYAWLFKLVKYEDLQYNGNFFETTWDVAMMIPMLEMAGDRFRFIPEVIYVYNTLNEISDYKAKKDLQRACYGYIRDVMQPYKRLVDKDIESLSTHYNRQGAIV